MRIFEFETIFVIHSVLLSDRTLDVFHTVMVATSNWFYLVESFGARNIHDTIYW